MSVPEHQPEIPDDALVTLAKAGDMVAFETLVGRHREKIYARAYSIVHNEQEAVDLSQEAWIKAWRRLAQFEGDSSFTTWLTRITINLCLDHLRRNQRHRVEPLPDSKDDPEALDRILPPVWVNPTERMEREEVRKRIDEAMARLSEAHRTVLVLHEFERMEYKHIAETLGISIGTVMSRLFYARRRMATLLAGWKRESEEEES
ncbi:MAG: sigma-70 family RNA polymerase sigma factor [Verrucomicrobiales bacterium]|nr:sigma-70 family RNA polymerase sigma factor [Verrucomicrobiales bacterium]